MHIDQTYSQFLLQGLNSLRQKNELCDVELKSGSTSLFAHRVVLSAMSDYFKAMFTGRMGECFTRTVHIKDADEKSLCMLTDFAYTGNISITIYNVQSLLITSNMLQISKVVDACCDFLIKQLNASNCLGFLEFADTYSLWKLKIDCEKYVTENFSDLLNYDEYLHLNPKIVKEVISNDDLNVCNEEIVFKFIEKWILFKKDRRIKYFSELFSEIRSFNFSSKFLTLLKLNSFISSNECYPLQLELNSVITTKTNPFRILDDELEKAKSVRRNSGDIIVVGGKKSLTQSLISCSTYNIEKKEWKNTVPLQAARQYSCCTSVNGTTYIVGGTSSNQCLNSLLSLKNNASNWCTLSSMNEKRSSHAIVSHRGLLYVLGGYNGQSYVKSMECYDLKRNEWTNLPCMNYSRCAFAAVVVEDFIYALGGQGTGNLSSVERYDIGKKKWELVPAMNNKRINFGAVEIHGYIFVVGGHDGKDYLRSMERYDPITSEWTVVSSMPSARTGLGIAVVKNRIYVFGGHDGSKYLDSSLKYDPVKDCWSNESSMDSPRCYMAVTDVWL